MNIRPTTFSLLPYPADHRCPESGSAWPGSVNYRLASTREGKGVCACVPRCGDSFWGPGSATRTLHSLSALPSSPALLRQSWFCAHFCNMCPHLPFSPAPCLYAASRGSACTGGTVKSSRTCCARHVPDVPLMRASGCHGMPGGSLCAPSFVCTPTVRPALSPLNQSLSSFSLHPTGR